MELMNCLTPNREQYDGLLQEFFKTHDYNSSRYEPEFNKAIRDGRYPTLLFEEAVVLSINDDFFVLIKYKTPTNTISTSIFHHSVVKFE